MFSVRGMGVAESVSTSTWRLSSFMCSLCVTPKRCSSSTISSPRFLNCTSFCSSLCVPITRSQRPFWTFFSVSRTCAAVRKRLSTSICTG